MTDSKQQITFLHSCMVTSLKKPGKDIQSLITAEDCDLTHMVMGICGEAGELLDAIKKHVIYRKPLDLDHVIEEMGDIEFYMEGLRQSLLITRERILQANYDKLSKRYAEGTYSDQQAQDRADKVG